MVIVEMLSDRAGRVVETVGILHLSMAYDFLDKYVSEKDSDDTADQFIELAFKKSTVVKRDGIYYRFSDCD